MAVSHHDATHNNGDLVHHVPGLNFARARGGRRVFHPDGLVVDGRARIGGAWRPVTARLSKAMPTPGALPDVLGLALRLGGDDGCRGDLLLATAGRLPVARSVFVPAGTWTGPLFGSVLPMRLHGRVMLLGAVLESGSPLPSSTSALREALDGGRIRGELVAAPLLGPWVRIGTLELQGPAAGDALRPLLFAPVRDHPAALQPVPGAVWSRLREPAYVGSQEGRTTRPPDVGYGA